MDVSDKLKLLAKDLTQDFPRSPRAKLAGYVVAGRALDKCRAVLAGTAGEYHFNCPLDQQFFEFAGIDGDAFKDFVATGATDEEVAAWIKQHASQSEDEAIIAWNNKLRYMRPVDMPMKLQVFLEGYIDEVVPRNRIVNYWFDVYDIEEHRI
ncbi:MAG: hypothetical protein E1N59_2635 [Puniceicoccaceae bacterium 5H]|nr:MAG: hypothetical protein E1N59_2635 [Puniceicoccaceae bacterium 5H]